MIWLLLACQPDKSAVVYKQPSWTWLATDPHVHSSLGSNDTDGLGTPDRIQAAMANAGLDLIWMTDHSNSQGSMSCDDVEDCPNQGPEVTEGTWPDNVLLASELSPRSTEDNLSEPVGHIGCLPNEVDAFDSTVFVDRPFGDITGADAVQQCHDAGGIAILNHPFGPTSWVSFDWTSLDFDGIELYNGGAGFDASDEAALLRWEESLKDGHRWFPIGASDCHRWSTAPPGTLLDSPLGWPRTWLAIQPEDQPVDALRKGQVILGDPNTQLRYWAATEDQTALPGEQIDTAASLFVNASTDEPDMVLQIIDLLKETTETHTLDEDTLSLQIKVEAPALIYVRVWPTELQYGQRGIALGNVIEWKTP